MGWNTVDGTLRARSARRPGEHVVPYGLVPAPVRRFARLRLWPLWLRVVGAIVLCALLVVLAPLVTLAALVVLVTAIVAMARGSRTWLRFPSRGAVIALVVRPWWFGVAGALTGLVYPTKCNGRNRSVRRSVRDGHAVDAFTRSQHESTPWMS